MFETRTFYRVRFICYQYNCGGSMINGYHRCHRDFEVGPEAKEFANKVRLLSRQANVNVPEGSNELANNYVHDGFVERLDGVFKITEERVNL